MIPSLPPFWNPLGSEIPMAPIFLLFALSFPFWNPYPLCFLATLSSPFFSIPILSLFGIPIFPFLESLPFPFGIPSLPHLPPAWNSQTLLLGIPLSSEPVFATGKTAHDCPVQSYTPIVHVNVQAMLRRFRGSCPCC